MSAFTTKNNEDAIKIFQTLMKHANLNMREKTAELSALALHGTLTCKNFDYLIKDLEDVITTLKKLSIDLSL